MTAITLSVLDQRRKLPECAQLYQSLILRDDDDVSAANDVVTGDDETSSALE
jgi:hypothetical protein